MWPLSSFFKRQGQNLELKLPVTLAEAALGGAVDVPTPGGIVSLKIPAGSSSGRRLRVKGQGIRSPSGEPGDLYVELQIKLPETLSDEARKAVQTINQQYTGSLREDSVGKPSLTDQARVPETFPKSARIHSSLEFDQLFQTGKVLADGSLVMHARLAMPKVASA